MNINIWEVHPKACRIEPAEKTCMGKANKGATQWCGPYVNANESGFWVYPPVDMEFVLSDDGFKVLNCEEYGDDDFRLVESLIRQDDQSDFQKWTFPGTGRTKMTFGLVEPNVIQIWTGLIFETAPGWCLHIRSPINMPNEDFTIVEAVLETDWMQYDIWMNLSVNAKNKPISIRKQVPIAQLVPTRRETFKGEWSLKRSMMNRDTPEAERVFEYWLRYNKQKFENGGNQALSETLTKDSTTYLRERSRILGKEMEPSQSKCPFAHFHEIKKPIFEPLEESPLLRKFSRKT